MDDETPTMGEAPLPFTRPRVMALSEAERRALSHEELLAELDAACCMNRVLEDRLGWYADVHELLRSGAPVPQEALRARVAGGTHRDHPVDLNAGVYRGFFDSKDVAILRHAGDQLVDCNEACLRMFGLASVEELRSLGCASTLSPEFQPDGTRSADSVAKNILPVMRQGFSHFTWLHQRRDGSTFPAEVFVYRMGDESSVNYQSIVRDLTEEKERERREAENRARLEKALRFEAMGQAAGTLAHDFNNILRGIHFAAEGYLERESPENAREAMGRILDCTSRATEWIRQILSLGTLDPSGGQAGRPFLEVHAVITSVARLLPSHLRPHQTLALTLTAGATRVSGAASTLERALLNLCLNARDAMPDGGTLTLRTSDTLWLGRPALVIEVADTGTGMPEEVRSRIFEPFFSTKGTSGRGLGLAFAHKATLEMGGDIQVESTPCKGTTFRIVLPLASQEPEPETFEGPNGPHGATRGSHPEASGARFVLVVDDDVDIRIAMTGALLAAGERVLTDDSVRSALETLENMGDRIGIVLSDLSLPDGSGHEILEAVNTKWPHAACVLMSSSFATSERGDDGRWARLSKLSPLTHYTDVVSEMKKSQEARMS